jgi:DNA-directed RNA polymerase subunit RPC12/RpoP
MAFLPCFLCRKQLDLRLSKTKKPYFVCEDCGMQIFVRGKRGIERLQQLLGSMSRRKVSRNR